VNGGNIVNIPNHSPAALEKALAEQLLISPWFTLQQTFFFCVFCAFLRPIVFSIPATWQYGPGQVVEFHNATNAPERDMQARRAYELVQHFLKLLL
jgi:hypothetical protein